MISNKLISSYWQIYLLIILSCIILTPVYAAKSVGYVSFISGRVDVFKRGKLPAIKLKKRARVYETDVVRTKSRSNVEIQFNDGNRIRINQRSRIDLKSYKTDNRVILLPRGRVQVIVKKVKIRDKIRNKISNKIGNKIGDKIVTKRFFEVHTPSSVLGVRGTNFFVFQEKYLTKLLVKEGLVYSYNKKFPKQQVLVDAGKALSIYQSELPTTPIPVTEFYLNEIEQSFKTSVPKTNNDSKSQDSENNVPQEQKHNSTAKGEPDSEHGADAEHKPDSGAPHDPGVLYDSEPPPMDNSSHQSDAPPPKLSSYPMAGEQNRPASQPASAPPPISEQKPDALGPPKDSEAPPPEEDPDAPPPEEDPDAPPPGGPDAPLPRSSIQQSEYSVANGDENLPRLSIGYGADLSTASSWISVGENNGTFNPDNYTWSSVKNGMWIETSQLLNMLCPAGICNSDGKNLTLEQQKLQAMQVPVVEVGRTNLSGSWNSGVNSINVNMNDVVFFAPNNGQAPSLWATDQIMGQFTGNPSGAKVLLQGDGLQSQFNLQQWDTQNNTWLSTITNGQGSIKNGGSNTENINFQGAGAGHISPIKEIFSGTASGVSKQIIP